MKKYLLLLILFYLLVGKIQAQYIYSPNTYYLIPPTSGCNGIWAVQYPPNCFATTSFISPFGCATINHFNGDTLFFDLCAIPCDFIVVNDSGTVCMNCLVFLTTSIDENVASDENLAVYPNPANDFITLKGNIPKFATFILSNSTGEEIIRKDLNEGLKTYQMQIKNLADGVYLWKLISASEIQANGKVVIVK